MNCRTCHNPTEWNIIGACHNCIYAAYAKVLHSGKRDEDEAAIAFMGMVSTVTEPDDIGKSNQRESDYWRRVGGHDELSALGEE